MPAARPVLRRDRAERKQEETVLEHSTRDRDREVSLAVAVAVSRCELSQTFLDTCELNR